MVSVTIGRLDRGPELVIEDAEHLALDFFQNDRSSKQGGFDDLAGKGNLNSISTQDVTAINTTMRARSAHKSWAPLTCLTEPWPRLEAIDPEWDLIGLEDHVWLSRARSAVKSALDETTGQGRGLSVATKMLHLKRPRLFPVLDSLVLQQIGATHEAPIKIVEHLRTEGQRNADALRRVQNALQDASSRDFHRPLVRVLDMLIWTSHPAAGISDKLAAWEHVVRRRVRP